MAIALLLGTHAIAWAHATLVASEPAANAHLTTSPPRVRLVFSEPVEPALARLSIEGPDRRVIRLAAAGDPRDVHAIVAPLDSLPPAAYRLRWRAVSADGHPIDGSYVFWIDAPGATTIPNAPAAPPERSDMAPSGPMVAGAPAIAALLRGLGLAALLALGGLLGFMWRPVSDPRPTRPVRVATWVAIAATGLLAGHLLAWLVHTSPDGSLTGDWIATALASDVGRMELWRVGLAALALWAIGLARHPRLALPFAVAAIAVSGATGHSNAILPLYTTPAKALHLLAGAAWLGGIVWLVICARGDRETLIGEADRVSALALIAVIVVALSGVAQTLLILPTFADVVRSTYGLLALAKTAGLLVLVAFGAHMRLRVLPALASDGGPARLRETLRLELTVMILVILLGGWLAYVPPPEVPAPNHTHATQHAP